MDTILNWGLSWWFELEESCLHANQQWHEDDKYYDGVNWGLNGDGDGVQGAIGDPKEAYSPPGGEFGMMVNPSAQLDSLNYISFQWLIFYVQVVEKLNGKAYGSVMILVTSGDDKHIGNCLLTVLSSGSTIHSIALGSSVVENLEELSHLTGKWISKNIF